MTIIELTILLVTTCICIISGVLAMRRVRDKYKIDGDDGDDGDKEFFEYVYKKYMPDVRGYYANSELPPLIIDKLQEEMVRYIKKRRLKND